MADQRIKGTFTSYYLLEEYGVIKGNDGQKYFTHKSDKSSITTPEAGMSVSFLADKRNARAYDVQLDFSIQGEPNNKILQTARILSNDDEVPMFVNEYLNLKEIFSPEILWEIKPKRLLGEVARKLANGKTGFIKLLVEIYYPDGSLMKEVYSGDLDELSVKDKVIFQLEDAREEQKKEKRQPHLQQAYDVVFFENSQNENLSYEFNPAKIASLGKRLNEIIADVDKQKMTIQEDVKRQLDERLEESIRDLDKMEKGIKELERKVLAREVELNEKAIKIELTVAEKVAEKKLELDKFEAQLKSYAAKIKEANEVSENRMQEVEGERKQLATDYVKFQELGGEQVVKIFAEEDQVEIKPFVDNSYTQNLHKGIHLFLEKQGYSINEAVSTQFFLSTLCAAISGQFVVLSGSTGVGKTSMVNMFASALGAGHGVVPVRPSWIDPTDLLGFYNPQLNRYQASPFMDYFFDAGKYAEANRMYFLTLDEMNLSRVENYAADFLSRLEKSRAGEKNACLHLYSKDIEQQLKSNLEKEMSASDKDWTALRAAGSHIKKYPSSVEIPEGLVMFGTVNLDDTTHHLSPKFLDRSFIINVPAQELAQQISKIGNTSAQSQAFFEMSLNSAKGLANAKENLSSEAQKIWEDVLGWQEDYIQPLGIRLGFRFSQMYVNFMKIAAALNVAPRAAASVFFQSKLLPWISFNRDEKSALNSDETKWEVLESWADDELLVDYPEEYGLKSNIQGIIERNSDSIIVRYLE